MWSVPSLLAMLAAAGSPQQPAPTVSAAPDEAEADVVIFGRKQFPRCKPLAGDPRDRATASAAASMQQVVVQDRDGRFRVRADNDPVTGPTLWQRAGTGMGAYTFRSPPDGSLLCIGADAAGSRSWGQLRRILDGAAIRGKYVRLTAFVAARPGSDARAWLAGDNRVSVSQGDRASKPLRITGRWEPFSVSMGPIRQDASKVSYGFLVQGSGQLWITQPELEVLDEKPID